MFAGCKDDQTSADTWVGGVGYTGACSYAFVKALSSGNDLTYLDLLASMRKQLNPEYTQIVQMSTNFATNMDTPFML